MFQKTLFVFTLLFFSSHFLKADNVPLITCDSAVSIAHSPADSNKTIVINFWATWCVPCVEELPYFIQADTTVTDSTFQFYFISMDRTKDASKVEKFLKKMPLPGENFILDCSNINNFINDVDIKWQGGIPLTIVISPEGRFIHEGSFANFKQLWQFIRQ